MGEIIRHVSACDAEKIPMEKPIDSRMALATVAAIALAVTFLYSVRTSGAQFTARTENSSNEFWAGQIDVTTNLVQPVLLISDGIYPGVQITECMEVSYVGTVESVSTRMFASALEGGLGDYLDIRIDSGVMRSDSGGNTNTNGTDSCESFEAAAQGSSVFDGTLADFAQRHGTYENGFDLGLTDPGDTIALRITAEVQDNNEAQGLSADFSFFLEGRP